MVNVKSLNYKISRLFCKLIIVNSEKIFKLFKVKNLPNFDFYFKENFFSIKKEVLNYMKDYEIPSASDISIEQFKIENENKWKVLILKLFKVYNVKNCKLLPNTFKIVKKYKNIQTVIFSKMSPHTHIKRHRGVFNGVVRYHLGIKIPKNKDNTFIIINDVKKYWSEGESFIFDDTEYHEAFNNTDEDRIILMIDYERPLPWFLNFLNKLILFIIKKSPLIQNSIENMENLNK